MVHPAQVHPVPRRPGRTMRAHRQNQRFKKEVKDAMKPGAKLLTWTTFTRFVREVCEKERTPTSSSGKALRWQQSALSCLKEAAEEYLSNALSGAYLCTRHRNSITLTPKDLNLYRVLVEAPSNAFTRRATIDANMVGDPEKK